MPRLLSLLCLLPLPLTVRADGDPAAVSFALSAGGEAPVSSLRVSSSLMAQSSAHWISLLIMLSLDGFSTTTGSSVKRCRSQSHEQPICCC